MKKSNLALAGGDPRVVAHPSLREIPKCLFPLKSKKAKDEYDTLARMIFDAGQMTASKHRQLSTYAAQFDVIHSYPDEGKMLKAANFIQLDKALKALKLDEIDKPVGIPQGQAASKYALCGFASRRR